ncbi:unnamed protein product [Orchesella dallaii]|uniref:Uncharacterized protein n=1 Tax=Orchesella dallaii TaxID=48710 RepID=A0ABP1R2I2_9HEXA
MYENLIKFPILITANDVDVTLTQRPRNPRATHLTPPDFKLCIVLPPEIKYFFCRSHLGFSDPDFLGPCYPDFLGPSFPDFLVPGFPDPGSLGPSFPDFLDPGFPDPGFLGPSFPDFLVPGFLGPNFPDPDLLVLALVYHHCFLPFLCSCCPHPGLVAPGLVLGVELGFQKPNRQQERYTKRRLSF